MCVACAAAFPPFDLRESGSAKPLPVLLAPSPPAMANVRFVSDSVLFGHIALTADDAEKVERSSSAARTAPTLNGKH